MSMNIRPEILKLADQRDERRQRDFLAYFVPKRMTRNSDDLFRSRILVGILLTYVALLVMGAILFGLFTPLGYQYKNITYMITSAPAVLFLLMLFFYKRIGNHAVTANLMIATAFLLAFVGIAISGGPLLSPANYVLPVPPLLAFCIVGNAAGFFWATAVLLTQLVGLILSLAGFQWPFMVDPENEGLNESIDWIIAYFAVIAIAFVNERMLSKLRNERDDERRRYEFMAHHDVLTGLPNRLLFRDRLDGAIQRAKRHKMIFALLYLDLDCFKAVNDDYGHPAGDLVLQKTAERIKAELRSTDVVARLGGDEFAVIMEELEHARAVEAVVEKLEQAVTEPVDVGPARVSCGVSIGIAIYPQDGTQGDALLKIADARMYENKQGHRHR